MNDLYVMSEAHFRFDRRGQRRRHWASGRVLSFGSGVEHPRSHRVLIPPLCLQVRERLGRAGDRSVSLPDAEPQQLGDAGTSTHGVLYSRRSADLKPGT